MARNIQAATKAAQDQNDQNDKDLDKIVGAHINWSTKVEDMVGGDPAQVKELFEVMQAAAMSHLRGVTTPQTEPTAAPEPTPPTEFVSLEGVPDNVKSLIHQLKANQVQSSQLHQIASAIMAGGGPVGDFVLVKRPNIDSFVDSWKKHFELVNDAGRIMSHVKDVKKSGGEVDKAVVLMLPPVRIDNHPTQQQLAYGQVPTQAYGHA